MRLPAKSTLLFVQNQRGGTESPHPTIPTTRPNTADIAPIIKDKGSGSSTR